MLSRAFFDWYCGINVSAWWLWGCCLFNKSLFDSSSDLLVKKGTKFNCRHLMEIITFIWLADIPVDHQSLSFSGITESMNISQMIS